MCGSTTIGYLDYTGLLAGIIDPHVDLGTCVATLKPHIMGHFRKMTEIFHVLVLVADCMASLGFSLFAKLEPREPSDAGLTKPPLG